MRARAAAFVIAVAFIGVRSPSPARGAEVSQRQALPRQLATRAVALRQAASSFLRRHPRAVWTTVGLLLLGSSFHALCQNQFALGAAQGVAGALIVSRQVAPGQSGSSVFPSRELPRPFHFFKGYWRWTPYEARLHDQERWMR